MKPYGNEHMYFGDGLNSTRTGATATKNKRDIRRIAKKAHRKQDRDRLRKEEWN